VRQIKTLTVRTGKVSIADSTSRVYTVPNVTANMNLSTETTKPPKMTTVQLSDEFLNKSSNLRAQIEAASSILRKVEQPGTINDPNPSIDVNGKLVLALNELEAAATEFDLLCGYLGI